MRYFHGYEKSSRATAERRGFLLNQRVACLSPAVGAVYVARCHAEDDELEATELIRRPAGARILSRHRRRPAETARRFFPFSLSSFFHDWSRYHPSSSLDSRRNLHFVKRRVSVAARVSRREEAHTLDNCLRDDYLLYSSLHPPCDFFRRKNCRFKKSVYFLDENIVFLR